MADSIVINGERRFLGCLPRIASPGSVLNAPLFSERIKRVPRDQWIDISWKHFVKQILDQDGQGSCVGASGVGSMMFCRAVTGLSHVELSIGSLYGQINRGRDAGALLSDSIEALTTTGVCPATAIPHLNWKTSQWPANWKELAQDYRALEAYDCPEFDDLASAILKGFVVCYGIMVGSNFNTDNEGCVPLRPSGGGGGHALYGVGLKYLRNRWWIETVNSWSEKWGMNGIGYVPDTYFTGSFVDGWALRSVTISN